jgi:hypothetical protein
VYDQISPRHFLQTADSDIIVSLHLVILSNQWSLLLKENGNNFILNPSFFHKLTNEPNWLDRFIILGYQGLPG